MVEIREGERITGEGDLGVTLLADIDRIGLDQETYKILGIRMPMVTIPVRPGRDIARLVEVAALDQKLKSMGHNSAKEFNERLIRTMQPAAALESRGEARE